VIRGAIRRKIWICPGDIVLVGIRDFEEGKVDILSKYSPEEAKALMKEKEIPPSMGAIAAANEDRGEGQGQGAVDFVNFSSDDEEDEDDDVDRQPEYDFDALARRDDDEEETIDISAI
jgi:translation initiation factor 1A